MQFTNAVLVVALSAFTAAQDTGSIPSCALACFPPAFQAAGCAITDQVCGCTTGREAITENVTPCVISSCPQDQALLVQSAADAICATATAGGAASTPTEAATSAAASASEAISSAAMSASDAVSSAASMASEAVSSAASMATASSSRSTGAGAQSTGSSSAAPTQTGAANGYQVQAGVMAGGLAFAAALL